MTTKTATKTTRLPAKQKSGATCKFAFSDARSCAMPRWNRHRSYCLFHARQEQQLIDTDRIGDELAAFSGEFRTSTDLNHALSNLFKAVAQNRIPPRNAAVLAYIGQLLQQNISDVQHEITCVEGYQGLNEVLRRALNAHDGKPDTGEEDDEEEEDDNEETDVDDNDANEEAETARDGAQDANFQRPGYRFHPNHGGGIWVPIEPPSGTGRDPSAK